MFFVPAGHLAVVGRWRLDLHFPAFLSSWLYAIVKALVQSCVLARGTSPQTLTLFSHLGLNMTISQHAQIPLQLLLHYQSATGLNNNALSPQACNNTCWRDQQLANASINQGPRVLFDAENGPKVLFNTGSANPTQIHPIQPCPFCSPSMHFCLFLSVHFISLAPSWVILMLKKQVFVVVASWDLRMRYETSIVYIRDSVRAWTRPSCVDSVSDGGVHAYVNSCLYSWALTGMLAHGNGTDVYSPLMHYSRMMTPPFAGEI